MPGTKYWKIIFNKAAESAEIFIYEQIGKDYWSEEGIGAKEFAKELRDLGDIKKLSVHINSPGGNVFEGLAIFNQLKAHKAYKVVHIDGLAASIASVIAMSGDEVIMPENALLMIHDPTGMVIGNSEDMKKMAEILDKTKTSLITAYRDKTGMSEQQIADLMTNETWMDAKEAISYGFADEMTEAVKIAASFDLTMFKKGKKIMEDKDDKQYRKDLYSERERVIALRAISKEFNISETLLDESIQEGWTEDQLRVRILETIKARSPHPGPRVSKSGNISETPFNSFGDQLIAIKNAGTPGGRVDQRLYEINNAAGMNETWPSEGGFAIQPDFTTELLTKSYETAVLAPLCAKIPVSGNGLKAPIIDETSRATGSRLGGVQCYWIGEGTEVSSKKPKLAMLQLGLKKLMGICYATDELLEDQNALQGVVSKGFTEEISFMVDAAIVAGSGSDSPSGILNSKALVTISKETGQLAATIVAENIINMYSRMHRQGKTRGVWLLNNECWPQIFQLNMSFGTSSVPMFMPPGGLSASPYGTIFGRPVIEIEQCEALGTAGDIIFADLSQYLLIDKASGADFQVSIHVRFLSDETAFRFTYRVDGQSIWKAPLTPYKGSSQVSPFIILEDR